MALSNWVAAHSPAEIAENACDASAIKLVEHFNPLDPFADAGH